MDGDAGVDPRTIEDGGAAAPTGLAYLLVPGSGAYQAILDLLAAEPERPLTATELAASWREPVDTVESRLHDLTGWGNVRRAAAPDRLADYRAGAERYVLTALGLRVWRMVAGTRVERVAVPGTSPVDVTPLLRLARRFDESSDAEAHALYAEAFGVPVPVAPVRPAPAQGPAADLAVRRRELAEHAAEAARVRVEGARELHDAAADLARRRLSPGAFALLIELIGRAVATAAPDGDGYVADPGLRLELQLLASPGTLTPLYGDDGVVTLDGFKVRLSALGSEATGGA